MPVATPSKSLLGRKAGPLPVWQWAAILLAAAIAYSRYKAGKSSSSSSDTTASSSAEPSSGAPYFVIENNEPPDPSSTSVIVSPPATGASPPVGHAGASPGRTVTSQIPGPSMGGTTVKPGELIQPPVEVKKGDTWASIAKRYGISAQHLQSANQTLGTGPLKVGQVIGVPYEVKPGMTVQSIAKDFGISVPHLEEYLPKNPT